MNISKIIRSNDFATWAAILAMVLQSKHTYMAYLSVESLDPNWVDMTFAVLAAIAIDVAILFYTLRNRRDIALGAMATMIVINSYAYWDIHQALTWKFYASQFLGLVIPVSVFYYSEEIKVTRQKKS